jgi:hypothetical protein
MKDSDYNNILEFANMGGGLIPVNQPAHDLLDQTSKGEIIAFQEVTARDINFHRGYMALLNFIYDYLPQTFQRKVPKKNFYQFVKHLKGDYDVVFQFADGSQLVEYKSIAFGKMSQKTFEAYVREQLPYIYEHIIYKLFDDQIAKNIIETIEEEFKKFLAKL